MASDALLSWRQQGLVSLWRYVGASRSYRGWHLSGNPDGCRSLLALIDALSDSSPVLYRTVSLAPPSEALLAVSGRMFSGVEGVSKLRVARCASPAGWDLTASKDVVSLSFGEIWRGKLREAANAMLNGGGDFQIGSGDGEHRIWFWWWKQ